MGGWDGRIPADPPLGCRGPSRAPHQGDVHEPAGSRSAQGRAQEQALGPLTHHRPAWDGVNGDALLRSCSVAVERLLASGEARPLRWRSARPLTRTASRYPGRARSCGTLLAKRHGDGGPVRTREGEEGHDGGYLTLLPGVWAARHAHPPWVSRRSPPSLAVVEHGAHPAVPV
jgi:hypothetical protein